MPTTREQHVIYTRNELNDYQYYIDVLKTLTNENITTYMDIGANVGEFYNVLSEKLPTINQSYLIEPEQGNFNFMCDNVKDENVIFLNYGIGYDLRNPRLITSSNVGGHSISESDVSDVDSELVIKTLEELNLPLVDLVKMDIEGGELNILANSSYIQEVKWLEIEFHQTPQQSIDKFVPNYITKYLPNHSVMVYDQNPLNFYGRCLLKLN
jgi:FkbM family methyltransferase